MPPKKTHRGCVNADLIPFYVLYAILFVGVWGCGVLRVDWAERCLGLKCGGWAGRVRWKNGRFKKENDHICKKELVIQY